MLPTAFRTLCRRFRDWDGEKIYQYVPFIFVAKSSFESYHRHQPVDVHRDDHQFYRWFMLPGGWAPRQVMALSRSQNWFAKFWRHQRRHTVTGATLAFFDFTAVTNFAFLYFATLKVENSLNVSFSTVLFLEGKCFTLSVPLWYTDSYMVVGLHKLALTFAHLNQTLQNLQCIYTTCLCLSISHGWYFEKILNN